MEKKKIIGGATDIDKGWDAWRELGVTTLVLIGASVRAAAFSAMRAGFTPWCVDLFADEDLRRTCSARCIAASDYPHALERAIQEAPPGPWMYTGGLENHPRLIERIAKQRILIGNGARVLGRVRSPAWLAEIAANHGMAYPKIWKTCDLPPSDRRWLVKPRKGSGGARVRFLACQYDRRRSYLQEFVEGPACSAVFRVTQGRAEFMGATRQIIGPLQTDAGPDFRYRGSVGPIALPESTLGMMQRWGDVLVAEAGIDALFGIDFVLDDDVPYLIEVNPRYTASVEILERGVAAPGRIHGKAIVFAAEDMVVEDGPWYDFASWRDWPKYADIPAAGTRVRRGRPVMTVFATGKTEEEVLASLTRESFFAIGAGGALR